MNSTTAARRSIEQVFGELARAKRIGLVAFIPAGYPNLATTSAVLPALEAGGASVIEVGFPFSDPIADGPTIQAAFTETLKAGLKVDDIFAAVARERENVSIPIVGMLSYSIVWRYGVKRFVAAAKSAGFDGLILPDLPPPEAQSVCGIVRAGGLDTTLLVAPTTTPARRAEIAKLSSGFIYYLSVSGITGERDQLPTDVAANVRQLKSLTDRPVCVGFGIHRPQQIAQLAGVADGAIVGTAFVKQLTQHAATGPAGTAERMTAYTRELLALASYK
ncbi:MAG TPA: tryptophan synthase subunit alpha [Humisphaera sp.]|jgi:tryptophan synthase alpha chain|nr:tryptophan synthase subunit alpha [Humisphaera sp.]